MLSAQAAGNGQVKLCSFGNDDFVVDVHMRLGFSNRNLYYVENLLDIDRVRCSGVGFYIP